MPSSAMYMRDISVISGILDISETNIFDSIKERVKDILSTERMEDRLPSKMEKIEALMFLDEMISCIKKPTVFHLILAFDIKERELRLWWAKERHNCETRNHVSAFQYRMYGLKYVEEIPEDPSVKGIFLTKEEKEMSNSEIWDKIGGIQKEISSFIKMKLSQIIERCEELYLI